MKFQVQVSAKRKNSEPWWESHDKHEIHDLEKAEQFGKEAVAHFNDTLRPHEIERVYHGARLVADSKGDGIGPAHVFRKENIYTMKDHRGMFDVVKCEHCGVRARRYGIDRIKRQKPFTAKKYQYCSRSILGKAKP